MADKTATLPKKARATKPASPTSAGATPATGKSMEARNRRIARAIVIGPVMKQHATGETREVPVEGFATSGSSAGALVDIITPPLDPLTLAMLPENSGHLGQCIEAMVVNIDGFGHQLKPLVDCNDPECPEALKKAVALEKIQLRNFFRNCSLEDTFRGLRKRRRRDLESVGWAAWEVVRDSNGMIRFLNHIPAYTMRLTKLGKEPVTVKQPILTVKPDGSFVLDSLTTKRRFRRYVQKPPGSAGEKYVWFKEYGDVRHMSAETGEYQDDPYAPDKEATELIYWPLPNPRTPYGTPRYLGNLLTIYGDRAADEVNYITLRNNNIPSMIVAVANGQLTEGSITRIRDFVETQIQGSDNYSRFLIVEAEAIGEEGGDLATMKMDIKPLTNEQMRDMMFGEYSDRNRKKIRESFRLPPIFVGASDDYTRATADASRKLADEQIFGPEREEFDDWMNKFLFPEMGVKYHTYVSNSPNVTNDEDLIRVLIGGEKTGGMTPELSREIIGDILGRDLKQVTAINPQIPFSIQLAEAAKNTADPNPSSQTGAAAPTLDGDVTASLSKSHWIGGLLSLRETLEEELEKKLLGQDDEYGLPERRDNGDDAPKFRDRTSSRR